MTEHHLIITEGPHDQAAISRILLCNELTELTGSIEDLPHLWQSSLIPRYPSSGKLHERLSLPSIFKSKDSVKTVAVRNAGGFDGIQKFKEVVNTQDLHKSLTSFGIVIDLDRKEPAAVISGIRSSYQGLFPEFPDRLEVINDASVRCGVFAMPGNGSNGVLESLLESCAEHEFSCLATLANTYLDQAASICNSEFRNFDRSKAFVATVGSVLRPGSTNTVTIKHDKWITKETLANVEGLTLLQNFLKGLIQW